MTSPTFDTPFAQDYSKLSVTVVFAWRSGTKLRLGRLEKQQTVSDAVRTSVANFSAHAAELKVQKWSPDIAVEDDTLLYMPQAEVGDHPAVTWDGAEGTNSLPSALTTATAIPIVDPKELQAIFLYAFVLDADGATPTVFLRKSNPKRYLESSKWYIDLTAPALKLIRGELMAFDDRFDFVAHDGNLYIGSERTFQYVFRDSEALRVQIPMMVSSLADAILLSTGSNDALLKVTGKQIRPRKKLEAIVARGHLETVESDHIRARLLDRSADRLAECMDDEGGLVFTEANTAFLLSFLNEDFFHGELTETPFQADRKVVES